MTDQIDKTNEKSIAHENRFPIRWSDIDAFGHVNNAIYFRYFEQIRADWMTELGCPRQLTN